MFEFEEKNDDIELSLLLEALHRKYGYDFRLYSRTHVKRRITQLMTSQGIPSISHLQHLMLYDSSSLDKLLSALSINVTEMFRDPFAYHTLRTHVLPELAKLPHFKIWHAGCATGEEVYSMAIMLKEEGLYDKALLYATDFNDNALRKAKEGIYPTSVMKEYSANYQQAGGTASLADYFTSRHESVIMHDSLKKNIVFANHNLVTDSVFGEMDLILCRNVLIYFSRPLQDTVIRLFTESLSENGFLCLGTKESLRFSPYSLLFDVNDERSKIYRRNSVPANHHLIGKGI